MEHIFYEILILEQNIDRLVSYSTVFKGEQGVQLHWEP